MLFFQLYSFFKDHLCYSQAFELPYTFVGKNVNFHKEPFVILTGMDLNT